MRLRSLTVFIGGAVAVALAVLAAACGDDGGRELSLQEYLTRLEAIIADADARFEAAPPPEAILQDPQVSLEEKKDAAREYFNSTVGILDAMIGQLDGLEARAEARDAHDQLLAGERAIRDAGQAALDKIDAVADESEFQGIADEFFSAAGPFVQACEALQGIADTNNIAVDLNC